jgi:hypothetical protein
MSPLATEISNLNADKKTKNTSKTELCSQKLVGKKSRKKYILPTNNKPVTVKKVTNIFCAAESRVCLRSCIIICINYFSL